MAKYTASDLIPLKGGDIVNIIKGGATFLFEHKDEIREAFAKVSEFFRGIGGSNSPSGRLKRIEVLEAQNILNKEEKKLDNAIIKALIERVEKLENK